MAFVDCASAFKCSVRVRKAEQDVDGKSIMEMMMLAAVKGSELEIVCEGPDAESCIAALTKLVRSGFDED